MPLRPRGHWSPAPWSRPGPSTRPCALVLAPVSLTVRRRCGHPVTCRQQAEGKQSAGVGWAVSAGCRGLGAAAEPREGDPGGGARARGQVGSNRPGTGGGGRAWRNPGLPGVPCCVLPWEGLFIRHGAAGRSIGVPRYLIASPRLQGLRAGRVARPPGSRSGPRRPGAPKDARRPRGPQIPALGIFRPWGAGRLLDASRALAGSGAGACPGAFWSTWGEARLALLSTPQEADAGCGSLGVSRRGPGFVYTARSLSFPGVGGRFSTRAPGPGLC